MMTRGVSPHFISKLDWMNYQLPTESEDNDWNGVDGHETPPLSYKTTCNFA
jgi:hypothetical protein